MEQIFQQPQEWKFIEDLQKPQEIYVYWQKPEKQIEPKISCEWEDPEGLLNTAISSLWKFMLETIPFPCPVTLRRINRSGKKKRLNWKQTGNQR